MPAPRKLEPAPDVAGPRPIHEQIRRAQVKQSRPDYQPGQSVKCGDLQAGIIGLGAPVAKQQECRADEQEQQRRDKTLGHEAHAHPDPDQDARARGAAVAQGIAVLHDGAAGEHAQVGHHLVRRHQHTQTADQDEYRRPAAPAAEQLAPGQAREQQRKRGEKAARQTCAVMQRQPGGEQLGEPCRNHVIQRRLVHIRRVRDSRHQPIAALQDVVHQPEAMRIFRLPRIVADQPGKHPHRAQQSEKQRLGQRDGMFVF